MKLAELPAAISDTHFMLVLEELIDNSFKFSSRGSKVVIEGKLDDGYINITIANRGRGMSKADISRIGAYMQFERGHYEQQGLGLGLAIAKKVIELYGGILAISSKKGAETKVIVRIPAF